MLRCSTGLAWTAACTLAASAIFASPKIVCPRKNGQKGNERRCALLVTDDMTSATSAGVCSGRARQHGTSSAERLQSYAKASAHSQLPASSQGRCGDTHPAAQPGGGQHNDATIDSDDSHLATSTRSSLDIEDSCSRCISDERWEEIEGCEWIDLNTANIVRLVVRSNFAAIFTQMLQEDCVCTAQVAQPKKKPRTSR